MAQATAVLKLGLLAQTLATHLDFSKGGCDLEDFFYQHAPSRTAENPTASSAIVDRVLGVGGTYRKPSMAHLLHLISAHEFTPEQRELLFRRERRLKIWRSFLQNQMLNDDELTSLFTRRLSQEDYSYVLERPTRFALAQREDLLEIFEKSSPASRIRAIAANLLPEYDTTVGSLVEDLVYGDYWFDRSATLDLIDKRFDLYDSFIEVANAKVLAQLAQSRHLTDLNRQRAVAGLDLALARRGEVRHWAHYRSETLELLVTNPRCHREVLCEILERLQLVEGVLPKVVGLIESRLSDFDTHPVYAGEFETETDVETIVWLSDLYFAVQNTHRRVRVPLAGRDGCARALVMNPNFMAHPHNADLDAYNVQVLVKTVDQPLTLHRTKEDDRPQEAFTPGEVPSPLDITNSVPTVRYIQHMLGSEASSYETLLGLANEWSGTLEELIECAAGLRA
jgi:hypothetical protein